MELIFLNLIYNSLESWGRNSIDSAILEINVSDEQITVTDNAGGAPKNIVDAFNTREPMNSSGLGLYLIKDSALMAGYDIEMTNTLYEGRAGLAVRISLN